MGRGVGGSGVEEGSKERKRHESSGPGQDTTADTGVS